LDFLSSPARNLTARMCRSVGDDPKPSGQVGANFFAWKVESTVGVVDDLRRELTDEALEDILEKEREVEKEVKLGVRTKMTRTTKVEGRKNEPPQQS